MLAGHSATEAAIGHAFVLLTVSTAVLLLWLLVLLYLVRRRRSELRRGQGGWNWTLWLGFPAVLALAWLQSQMRHIAVEALLYASILLYAVYVARSASRATPSNSLLSTYLRFHVSLAFALFLVIGLVALALNLGIVGFAMSLVVWGFVMFASRALPEHLNQPQASTGPP